MYVAYNVGSGMPGDAEGVGLMSTESLVVVKLDQDGGGQAPRVFEVLEQTGLLDEVSEHGVEMVAPGVVGFRIPRERTDSVVLALACGGFVNVRAYDAEADKDSTMMKGGEDEAPLRAGKGIISRNKTQQ